MVTSSLRQTNCDNWYFLFWLVTWFILMLRTVYCFQMVQVENADVNRFLVLPGSTACTTVSGEKIVSGIKFRWLSFWSAFVFLGRKGTQPEEAKAFIIFMGRSQCGSIISYEFTSTGPGWPGNTPRRRAACPGVSCSHQWTAHTEVPFTHVMIWHSPNLLISFAEGGMRICQVA